MQEKEAAKMSFEEVIAGYNKIKEDYHNSAIGAKDVIAAVFFEFHPVRPYTLLISTLWWHYDCFFSFLSLVILQETKQEKDVILVLS